MKLPRFIFQAKENLVEKVWGGCWIANFKGLKVFKKIGESWEFSAHPSRPSEVLVDGRKLRFPDLVSVAKKEILGKLVEKYSSFPLLVKILDIRERISVQVHPSDDIARALGEEESGKDEGWIILEGGKVYIGFKEDVEDPTADELREDVLSRLNKYDAEFLDTFMISAGTIHSAEDVRILEISSNSNITYRIFDFWGRDVQIEKAMKALNFARSGESEVRGEKGKLEIPGFAAEVLEVAGSMETSTDEVFNLLLCLDGSATLKSGGERAELKKGFSCLIPAITGNYTIESDGAMIVKIYAK